MTGAQAGQARIILGAEHDEALCRRLLDELKSRGGREIDTWSGLAGSQEISHLEVLVGGQTVVVETETYIGLSIEGPATLVAEIAAQVASLTGLKGASS